MWHFWFRVSHQDQPTSHRSLSRMAKEMFEEDEGI
jgi:hypothetical protein